MRHTCKLAFPCYSERRLKSSFCSDLPKQSRLSLRLFRRPHLLHLLCQPHTHSRLQEHHLVFPLMHLQHIRQRRYQPDPPVLKVLSRLRLRIASLCLLHPHRQRLQLISPLLLRSFLHRRPRHHLNPSTQALQMRALSVLILIVMWVLSQEVSSEDLLRSQYLSPSFFGADAGITCGRKTRLFTHSFKGMHMPILL